MAARLLVLLVICTAVRGEVEIPFEVLHKLRGVRNPADLFHIFNITTDDFGPEVSGPSIEFIPDSVPRRDPTSTKDKVLHQVHGRLGGLGGNHAYGGDGGIVFVQGSDAAFPGRSPSFSNKVMVSRQGADLVTSLISDIDFCSPRGTEVRIPNGSPSTIVVPSCVNLQRCGGCCHSNIFQCEPLETKNTTITVMKLGLSGGALGDELVLQAIEGIQMEEHVSCQCGCKVKQHHCNPDIHSYEDCACSCKVPRRDCEQGKVWDEKECQCVCQSGQTDCSRREYWNPDTCACECAPRDCPTGRTLDFTDCKCKRQTTRSLRPCSRRCPPGFQLIRHTCRCSRGQARGRIAYSYEKTQGQGSGGN